MTESKSNSRTSLPSILTEPAWIHKRRRRTVRHIYIWIYIYTHIYIYIESKASFSPSTSLDDEPRRSGTPKRVWRREKKQMWLTEESPAQLRVDVCVYECMYVSTALPSILTEPAWQKNKKNAVRHRNSARTEKKYTSRNAESPVQLRAGVCMLACMYVCRYLYPPCRSSRNRPENKTKKTSESEEQSSRRKRKQICGT